MCARFAAVGSSHRRSFGRDDPPSPAGSLGGCPQTLDDHELSSGIGQAKVSSAFRA
jgi:hypothetical protein